MSSSEDPSDLLSDMLQKLSIATEEERKVLLGQAKPHLLAPDASMKFKKLLETGDFSVIFDCMNSSDKNMVTATCDILSRIFEFVDSHLIIEKYGDLLKRGLNHPVPEVKEVILVVMNKSLQHCKNIDYPLLNHQR